MSPLFLMIGVCTEKYFGCFLQKIDVISPLAAVLTVHLSSSSSSSSAHWTNSVHLRQVDSYTLLASINMSSRSSVFSSLVFVQTQLMTQATQEVEVSSALLYNEVFSPFHE
jgi:hypothetical protein